MHFIKARVRELRAKDKTQTGLAQAMGVTPARVTEIMKGERQVKASELTAMSNYLEMSVADIVTALEAAALTPPDTRDQLEDSDDRDGPSSTADGFGAYVREWRERKGISPRELAKAVGVSPTVISRLEDEDWKPKEEKLLKIAEVLEIDGADLIDRAERVPLEITEIIKGHEARTSVGQLLRATKHFSKQELQDLIKQARKSKP